MTSKDYSFYYVLNNEEYNKFLELLETSLDEDYVAFILVLLNEVDNCFHAMLRILNVGSTNYSVFPPMLYSSVLVLIKEAIILTNYKDFVIDNKISATEMSKAERFYFADIDRNTINRTLSKYDLV